MWFERNRDEDHRDNYDTKPNQYQNYAIDFYEYKTISFRVYQANRLEQ